MHLLLTGVLLLSLSRLSQACSRHFCLVLAPNLETPNMRRETMIQISATVASGRRKKGCAKYLEGSIHRVYDYSFNIHCSGTPL